MKKQKVFMETDAEYVISIKKNKKKEKTTYKLNYTKAEFILDNAKGELVSKIVDNGNGMVVNDKFYEYHEFQALVILAEAVVKDDKNLMGKYYVAE